MLLKHLFLAIPLAIGWVIYTAQPSIGNILLGYFFSVVVLIAIGVRGDTFNLRNVPMQVINAVLYILFLAYEVLVSGIKVAQLTLHPGLPINPGMTKVNTQDETENPVISAISAHGITITPGELVIDFEETTDKGVFMIVHSLELDRSAPNLDNDQTKRLQQIKGILGYD